MKQSIKKSLPIILTAVSSVGTIATAYLAARATLKSADILKDTELSKKEKFKRCWKHYAPTMAVGAATIASGITGTIISKKHEAALTSALMASKELYTRYRGKVKEIAGEDVAHKIDDAMAKDYIAKHLEYKNGTCPEYNDAEPGDKIIVYEPVSGKLVECTPYDVKAMECEINKLFARDGAVMMDEVCKYLGMYMTPEQEEDLEGLGWSLEYTLNCYDTNTIDFNIRRCDDIDGMTIYVLEPEAEPIMDPLNYYFAVSEATSRK